MEGMNLNRISAAKVVVDVSCASILGIAILLFKTIGKPFLRGFHCDDDTIRYPFKESTVTNGVLIAVGVLLPIITIIIFETVKVRRESLEVSATQSKDFYICDKKVPRFQARLYVFIGYFLLGALFSQFMTDVCKYTVGRLRPHFLDVCRPDWALTGCNNLTSPEGRLVEHNYIDPIPCTVAEDSKELKEARLSFLSGHSSFGFYCAVYVVLYIQARVYYPMWSYIPKRFLQYTFLLMALATALSRISDYKHHWSDVFAGSILGISVAYIHAVYVAKLFERKEIPCTYQDSVVNTFFSPTIREPRNSVSANEIKNAGNLPSAIDGPYRHDDSTV